MIVVADDTDMLILFLFHFKPDMKNIYFRSESKEDYKRGVKLVNIDSAVKEVSDTVIPTILFIHACNCCDTTSATFGCDKISIFKKLKQSREVQNISYLFDSKIATKEENGAGLWFLL